MKCELFGAEKHVVDGFNSDDARVVLVCHFVLIRPKPTAAPHVFRLEHRQGFRECCVTLQVRRRVTVLEAAMVNRHDLRVGAAQRHVDGALDGVLHDFGEVHRLLDAFADFKHQRPVRPLLWLRRSRRRTVRQAQCRELGAGTRCVRFRVVTEDGAAVKRAVVLREVEPALEVVRVNTTQANAHDMGRRVVQFVGDGVLPHHTQGQVQRNRRQQLLVANLPAVGESYALAIEVVAHHLAIVALFLFRQELRHFSPDAAGASFVWEAKNGVGSPARVILLRQHIPDDTRSVSRCHALPEPAALHVSCGESPHLEIVWAHENVGNAFSHDAHNPLIKVRGFPGGHSIHDLGFYEAIDALDLVFNWQGLDVVLERVGNPGVLEPDVRDALVRGPANKRGTAMVRKLE